MKRAFGPGMLRDDGVFAGGRHAGLCWRGPLYLIGDLDVGLLVLGGLSVREEGFVDGRTD